MPAKHVSFTPELRREYLNFWQTMKVLPERDAAVERTAQKLLLSLDRYKQLEHRLNIPAAFIMCVHEREGGGRFDTYLGNGQSIRRVTTIVPKGRGPFETFEDGAYDALIVVQKMGNIPLSEWDEAGLAWFLEKMNGFGYRLFKHIPSPYLWGATNHQRRGKYIRDGVYDANVMDIQLGGMAIYAKIIEIRPELRLGYGYRYPADMEIEVPEAAENPFAKFADWVLNWIKSLNKGS